MTSARESLLVAGDVSALLVFALMGRRSHEEAAGLGALIETAAPFVAGWTVALIAIGLTSKASTPSPGARTRDLVGSALRVWVVAFPIAALFRALILGRFSPWTFYVVAFVAAFALLAAWRVAFALGERRFRRTVA